MLKFCVFTTYAPLFNMLISRMFEEELIRDVSIIAPVILYTETISSLAGKLLNIT